MSSGAGGTFAGEGLVTADAQAAALMQQFKELFVAQARSLEAAVPDREAARRIAAAQPIRRLIHRTVNRLRDEITQRVDLESSNAELQQEFDESRARLEEDLHASASAGASIQQGHSLMQRSILREAERRAKAEARLEAIAAAVAELPAMATAAPQAATPHAARTPSTGTGTGAGARARSLSPSRSRSRSFSPSRVRITTTPSTPGASFDPSLSRLTRSTAASSARQRPGHGKDGLSRRSKAPSGAASHSFAFGGGGGGSRRGSLTPGPRSPRRTRHGGSDANVDGAAWTSAMVSVLEKVRKVVMAAAAENDEADEQDEQRMGVSEVAFAESGGARQRRHGGLSSERRRGRGRGRGSGKAEDMDATADADENRELKLRIGSMSAQLSRQSAANARLRAQLRSEHSTAGRNRNTTADDEGDVHARLAAAMVSLEQERSRRTEAEDAVKDLRAEMSTAAGVGAVADAIGEHARALSPSRQQQPQPQPQQQQQQQQQAQAGLGLFRGPPISIAMLSDADGTGESGADGGFVPPVPLPPPTTAGSATATRALAAQSSARIAALCDELAEAKGAAQTAARQLAELQQESEAALAAARAETDAAKRAWQDQLVAMETEHSERQLQAQGALDDADAARRAEVAAVEDRLKQSVAELGARNAAVIVERDRLRRDLAHERQQLTQSEANVAELQEVLATETRRGSAERRVAAGRRIGVVVSSLLLRIQGHALGRWHRRIETQILLEEAATSVFRVCMRTAAQRQLWCLRRWHLFASSEALAEREAVAEQREQILQQHTAAMTIFRRLESGAATWRTRQLSHALHMWRVNALYASAQSAREELALAEERRRREAAVQLAAHIQVRMRVKQRRLTWSAWWRWISHGRRVDHKMELDNLRREFAARMKSIGLENARADQRRRVYLMKLTWVRAIDEKRSKAILHWHLQARAKTRAIEIKRYIQDRFKPNDMAAATCLARASRRSMLRRMEVAFKRWWSRIAHTDAVARALRRTLGVAKSLDAPSGAYHQLGIPGRVLLRLRLRHWKHAALRHQQARRLARTIWESLRRAAIAERNRFFNRWVAHIHWTGAYEHKRRGAVLALARALRRTPKEYCRIAVSIWNHATTVMRSSEEHLIMSRRAAIRLLRRRASSALVVAWAYWRRAMEQSRLEHQWSEFRARGAAAAVALLVRRAKRTSFSTWTRNVRFGIVQDMSTEHATIQDTLVRDHEFSMRAKHAQFHIGLSLLRAAADRRLSDAKKAAEGEVAGWHSRTKLSAGRVLFRRASSLYLKRRIAIAMSRWRSISVNASAVLVQRANASDKFVSTILAAGRRRKQFWLERWAVNTRIAHASTLLDGSRLTALRGIYRQYVRKTLARIWVRWTKHAHMRFLKHSAARIILVQRLAFYQSMLKSRLLAALRRWQVNSEARGRTIELAKRAAASALRLYAQRDRHARWRAIRRWQMNTIAVQTGLVWKTRLTAMQRMLRAANAKLTMAMRTWVLNAKIVEQHSKARLKTFAKLSRVSRSWKRRVLMRAVFGGAAPGSKGISRLGWLRATHALRKTSEGKTRAALAVMRMTQRHESRRASTAFSVWARFVQADIFDGDRMVRHLTSMCRLITRQHERAEVFSMRRAIHKWWITAAAAQRHDRRRLSAARLIDRVTRAHVSTSCTWIFRKWHAITVESRELARWRYAKAGVWLRVALAAAERSCVLAKLSTVRRWKHVCNVLKKQHVARMRAARMTLVAFGRSVRGRLDAAWHKLSNEAARSVELERRTRKAAEDAAELSRQHILRLSAVRRTWAGVRQFRNVACARAMRKWEVACVVSARADDKHQFIAAARKARQTSGMRMLRSIMDTIMRNTTRARLVRGWRRLVAGAIDRVPRNAAVRSRRQLATKAMARWRTTVQKRSLLSALGHWRLISQIQRATVDASERAIVAGKREEHLATEAAIVARMDEKRTHGAMATFSLLRQSAQRRLRDAWRAWAGAMRMHQVNAQQNATARHSAARVMRAAVLRGRRSALRKWKEYAAFVTWQNEGNAQQSKSDQLRHELAHRVRLEVAQSLPRIWLKRLRDRKARAIRRWHDTTLGAGATRHRCFSQMLRSFVVRCENVPRRKQNALWRWRHATHLLRAEAERNVLEAQKEAVAKEAAEARAEMRETQRALAASRIEAENVLKAAQTEHAQAIKSLSRQGSEEIKHAGLIAAACKLRQTWQTWRRAKQAQAIMFWRAEVQRRHDATSFVRRRLMRTARTLKRRVLRQWIDADRAARHAVQLDAVEDQHRSVTHARTKDFSAELEHAGVLMVRRILVRSTENRLSAAMRSWHAFAVHDAAAQAEETLRQKALRTSYGRLQRHIPTRRAFHRWALLAARDAQISERTIFLGRLDTFNKRITQQCSHSAAWRFLHIAARQHRSRLRRGWTRWLLGTALFSRRRMAAARLNAFVGQHLRRNTLRDALQDWMLHIAAERADEARQHEASVLESSQRIAAEAKRREEEMKTRISEMEALLETSADTAAARLQQALTEARLKLTTQQKKERATVVALEAELAESRSRVSLARESARAEVSRIQAHCSDRIRVAETERRLLRAELLERTVDATSLDEENTVLRHVAVSASAGQVRVLHTDFDIEDAQSEIKRTEAIGEAVSLVQEENTFLRDGLEASVSHSVGVIEAMDDDHLDFAAESAEGFASSQPLTAADLRGGVDGTPIAVRGDSPSSIASPTTHTPGSALGTVTRRQEELRYM